MDDEEFRASLLDHIDSLIDVLADATRILAWGVVLLFLLVLSGCFLATKVKADEVCTASEYGHRDGFSGSRTASGRTMRPSEHAAAHPTARFGSELLVTNLANGRQVVVEVTDRGPSRKMQRRGRCIDLYHGAAQHIGMKDLARVRVGKM